MGLSNQMDREKFPPWRESGGLPRTEVRAPRPGRRDGHGRKKRGQQQAKVRVRSTEGPKDFAVRSAENEAQRPDTRGPKVPTTT